MHRIAALPIVALTLLALSGCVGFVATSGAGAAAPVDAVPAGPYTVTIEGTDAGVGSATVTADQDGAGEQYGDQALPYSFDVKPGTSLLAVAAQETTGYTEARLSCTITAADGTVLKEAHSKGEYTTVSCATALP